MAGMKQTEDHSTDEKPFQPTYPIHTKTPSKCNCCRSKACKACTILTILMLLITLILALTLFKFKKPTTELLSASVEGISPRITLTDVQINMTLVLLISVHNPNRVSFKHGPVTVLLYYRGEQIADIVLAPGNIPSRGSVTIPCRLVLEADAMGSAELTPFLLSDIVAGHMGMDTDTRIAGRINVLGIKKHVAVTKTCHMVVALSSMKVESQDCSTKTKL